jgi:hypothetical protein
MITKWAAAAVCLTAVAVVSCQSSDTPIEGNGDIVTETRAVSDFDMLSATDGAGVVLMVDPAASGEADLDVTGDSNLLEFVTTTVEDSRLRASIAHRMTPTQAPEIRGIVAALSEVSVNDGATVTISGSVSDLDLSADNGAVIRADDLDASEIEVNGSNGSIITVCTRGPVTGKVTNGAELTVLCGGSVAGVETTNGGKATSAP